MLDYNQCMPLSGSGTRRRSYLIVSYVSTFLYDRYFIAMLVKAA